MDFAGHFRREVGAFEETARRVVATGDAPLVSTCPGWSFGDLVVHLGTVHRYVIRLLRERPKEQPDPSDLGFLQLPAGTQGWPHPNDAPNRQPVPATLADWFADGAATLDSLFEETGDREAVWTWSSDHTAGFWKRMQSIEAAVHRWDAEHAAGVAPQPVDGELAADAVSQTFEFMLPARRAWQQAPPGSGERYGFRRTDGPEAWRLTFEGDEVRWEEEAGPCELELVGTASDLMLFLWGRRPAYELDGVKGEQTLVERYFTLAPPV